MTVADKTQTFAKGDLPQEHRVLKGDSMMTMDHKPDRYVITRVSILFLYTDGFA